MSSGTTLQRLKSQDDRLTRAKRQRQALTLAALLSAAFSGCGDTGRSPNDTPDRASAPSHVDEQPATDASATVSPARAAETDMATVKSHELKGIWLGVADNTAVVIRFIGSESRQPGRAVVEGEWFVDVPGHTIGSGLEFIDDDAAGVVELEVGLWSIETGKSFRSSLGRVERGVSGRLYLSIYANEAHPAYAGISRISLTHISDHPKIQQDDVDRMLAAGKLASIGDLPEPDRQQFQALYGQFKMLEAQLAEAKEATTESHSAYAQAEAGFLRAENASGSAQRALAKYRSLAGEPGSEKRIRLESWLWQLQIRAGQKFHAEIDRISEFRRYKGEGAIRILKPLIGKDPFPEEAMDIAEMLPADPEQLTAEKALEILQHDENVKRSIQQYAPEKVDRDIEELAAQLSFVDDKEICRVWAAAQPEFAFYRDFLASRKPDEMTDAENRLGELTGAMTRIWPDWRQQLYEAEYSDSAPVPPL